MTEDASLDQFASSEAPETDDSTDSETTEEADPEIDDAAASEASDVEADADVPRGEDPATTDAEGQESEGDAAEALADDSAVELAVSTYEWSPEGGECADCGASVERRWRGEGQKDGGLVCADCKDW